ncbi:alpha/beta fold hydrolase [Polyangium aurulentum]|uniref:alpha/beta fold hydrolase n=1 Tax=Polyangium aurulentum TaxID=2567896 RepID=UPI0010AE4D7A|nr:alpha/beta fold hydrolase [Polyangium aurulentum]
MIDQIPGDDIPLAHRDLDVGGVRLHAVEAGSGPLVILLHGFPDFWYTWRGQIGALARAGFRVVAPDMRGYNLSDKPAGVASYRVPALVEDLAGLIRALGEERASVVGHDWGAAVAWSFAMARPEMLVRLCVLNGPHPARMFRALLKPRQLVKSWYMFFFQLPAIPEAVGRMNDYATMLATLRKEPLRPDAFTEQDLALYREALAQPGALTSMIHYYRAAMRAGPLRSPRRIDAPVLVLWGDKDQHLLPELADPGPDLVPNALVKHFADATHWLHREHPERVSQHLIEFLRG